MEAEVGPRDDELSSLHSWKEGVSQRVGQGPERQRRWTRSDDRNEIQVESQMKRVLGQKSG